MTDKAAVDTIRLRELAKAATPGPWKLTAQNMKIHWRVWIGNQHLDAPPPDAEYLSAVDPSVVLSLLDRIEELEEQLRVKPFKPQPWDLVPCNCGSLDHVHEEWCARAVAFREALSPKP